MIAFLASQGLPPGTTIDGWKVLESLGSGGFGSVQKVEKNGRLYAIKIALLPEGTPDEKKTHARTLRELLCLLLLDHPNIVRIVAHGRWPDETGGHLYLVLEYVEGWTLAQWVERTHPTVHEIIRVFVKIAAALAYMHARGVFHRDLKLINVLIRKSDGEPVIIDFGAAAFAQAPDITGAGLPPGTERYRAPEANRWWQLNRKKPKARYDFRVTDELFAFGVMLYDALTDPRPTEERDRSAVNGILVPPRDPQARNPRIPVALASLVRRLLSRKPAERPEDFEAVRRELEELLDHHGAEYKALAHSPSAQVEQHSGGAAVGDELREEAPVKVRSRRRLVIGGAVGAAALAAVGVYALGRGIGEPAPDAAKQLARQPEMVVATAPPSQSPGPMNSEALPPAAAPPATEPAPDSTVTASIQKEGSNVKTPKSTPPKAPGFASHAEFLAWCRSAAIVGTLAAANAGCPAAQVRPAPGDCPADAVKAMKEHGLREFDRLKFTFGGLHPGSMGGDPSPPLKSGRVEATVVFIEEIPNQGERPANLPNGTRLFGELWTAPDPHRPDFDEGFLRFDRVQLPNGPEFSVCIVSLDDGRISVEERPEPGAIRVGPAPNATVVYRWP